MAKHRDVSNSDDIIDSRDVIARIDELECEREALADDPEHADDLLVWDDDNAEELAALKALQEEAEGYSDWRHGATLIRDSYFEDYAQQFAEDIGAINDDATWPATCIDWKQAASELQQDYTSVEFDGVTYWVRS